MTFQNFHKHTYYTNIIIPDSACSIEDYAKRAVELGHGILSSVEHGWQGNYYEVYKIAKKHNLKFIFGSEAYFVIDRKVKDRTNCHICLFARNEQGRQEINEILSEANTTGFYQVPRLDLYLLQQLSWENVLVTSACLAFHKYGYDVTEGIVLKLKQHFKENFLLEVQYHNIARQKEINNNLLNWSKKYNIKIIMGCDSHYIYPKDKKERNNVLQAKGIIYQDEENCILDYPNIKTAIERFKLQNILDQKEIEEAINNTNIFLEFEDIEFNKNIKLPSIYKNKTQEEKDNLFKNLIWGKWNEYKKEVPEFKWDLYIKEIKKEILCVINTKMSDYFLLDYEIVKKGIEKGGKITLTGRGSSASFFINTLLGFSKIDRISSPVTMYPERFMSETRILQTKSLPDLDLNVGDPETFFEAQKELLGEHSSYQMIAYGKFKLKSAFKLYARAMEVNFQVASEVTRQIEKYENDLKHADDENSINLYDYIEEKYIPLIKESAKYQNIISDKKPHPCASLILDGDIRKEIGIMKIKSPKKDVFVAVIDGSTADEFKFLKNDLLKVDVVNIIHNTFKNIGIKPYSVNKLIQITQNDSKAWKIYAEGKTICLNQVEKEATKEKIMKYKPENISELTSFIAAIRPSFQSMYAIFEKREKFVYGIKAFDEILQTKDIKSSFLIYQEQIMATLSYAGIDNSETYGIIKAIAKKKSEQVKKWKEIFINGFANKIIKSENISRKEAIEKTNQVWRIIDDSCQYGFNASHAYAVALDSLYCCYLKNNHTLDFFEETLNYFADKSAKDKITLIKKEAEIEFGIKILPIKFKTDNRKFKANKNNTINESMVSVKYLNQELAKNLFSLRNNEYDNFIEVLEVLYKETCIQSNQLDILIRLNYFSDYGDINYLLEIVKLFNKFWQKASKNFRKQISKDKVKELGLNNNLLKRFGKERDKTYTCLNSKNIIIELSNFIIVDNYTEKEIIESELEYLGYIRYKSGLKKDRHKVYILDIDWGSHDKINPKVWIYSIGSGKIAKLKIRRQFCRFNKNQIIYITKIVPKPKCIYLGDNEKGKPMFEESKTYRDWWIEKWIQI